LDCAQTRYIHSVRETVRQHFRFFLVAALAAVALRLLFLFRFPAITADSLIYGDIAKNWLQHGTYGITDAGRVVPTCIRLPGYPAFLALVFSIFGVEHYKAALVLQIVVDLGTCFLIADMTRRVASTRAVKAAFLLAALCPFLANYAAAALTETWEIFFTVVALDCALAGLENLPRGKMRAWIGCGLSVGAAILLRPDGGLLLMGIGLYLLWLLIRPGRMPGPAALSRSPVLRAGLIVAVVALAPLVPWTWRNWHTLHQFQPLAPRYATQGSEFVPAGFNRWVKTWMADYISVEEIYWAVPGDTIDPAKLPSRTFDSPAQREQTLQLLAGYNRVLHITPAMDQQFAALAAERIRDAPLRYYVWLPLVRVADMWLRPRTGLLPSDTRWWEFNDDPRWSALAVALGAIGALYIIGAMAGLVRGKFTKPIALLLTFAILRSAFLGTLENPEPRYTLECLPVALLLVARLFH
jgi:4-amino-4-deoxy-L-arabinose transferase-like glycosyltransferase